MNTVDFGKNIFQFEIGFKIDCISPDRIRSAVEYFIVQRKIFTSIGKDPQTGQSGLTKGTGTVSDPIRQLRFSADKINMWAGWHTPYETWQEWRNGLLGEVANFLSLPVSMIAYLGSQATLIIPNDKIRRADEVPELATLLAFHSRYVPKDLFARSVTRAAFSDELANKNIEWWYAGAPGQNETTVNHSVRWVQMDETMGVEKNLVSFVTGADSWFENFHSVIVLPVTKV